jgi:UDP-2-acetamido-3-amino-2,3-dideoxy-glucuronate N-acetyltransferase
MSRSARIHPSAEVSPKAEIGDGAQIWHQAQVREGARVGCRAIVGKGVYVDVGVVVGDDCKLQNYVCTFAGVTLEAGVFVGPHGTFTNDLLPRAINADGSRRGGDDWTIEKTLVRKGATICANSTILCGIEIGAWAMVAAGSVVTKSVPAHGLVRGNPARLRGFVGQGGEKLELVREPSPDDHAAEMRSPKTGEIVQIPIAAFRHWKR